MTLKQNYLLLLCCFLLTLARGVDYVGCFRDERLNRDLHEKVLIRSDMTIAFCIEYCRRMNLCFAGLQYSSECYCGSSYGKYGILEEIACLYPCAGNWDETCGGNNANSVYLTGCVKVTSTTRTTSLTTSATMTPTTSLPFSSTKVTPSPIRSTAIRPSPENKCVASNQVNTDGGFLAYPCNQAPYDLNLYCRWRIGASNPDTMIEISFLTPIYVEYHFECNLDWIGIQTTDGVELRRYCGDNFTPDTITFPYDELIVTFRSDGVISRNGFNLHYKFIPVRTTIQTTTPTATMTTIPLPIGGKCSATHTMSRDGGALRFPSNSDYYDNGVSCEWVIGTSDPLEGIVITLIDMDIETSYQCSFDSLTVSAANGTVTAKYCGRDLRRDLYRFNLLVLAFVSDRVAAGRGFNLTYTFIYASSASTASPMPPTTAPPLASDPCLLNHLQSSTGGVVKYPADERLYPLSTHCTWLIGSPHPEISIEVSFIAIAIEDSLSCGFDSLTIAFSNLTVSARFCGSTLPEKKLFPTNMLLLRFFSDYMTNGRGFQLVYRYIAPAQRT